MTPLLERFVEYAASRGLGRRAFLVGGAVRDLLLGVPLKDVDIAVDRDPRETARDFAATVNASFVVLDEEYGIFRVVGDGHFVDFSPLRGGSIEEDLAGRDLTINAMALPLDADCRRLTSISGQLISLSSGTTQDADQMSRNESPLIDPYGGRFDLGCKVIRMVAEANFVSDPLRLLRAYRFAATLGFTIEVHTATAVRRHAALIESVAVERILEEMRHILRTDASAGVLEQMETDGLLDHIIPELKALSGEERFHNRQSYKYVEHILRNLTLYFPDGADRAEAVLKKAPTKVVLKIASLLGEATACRQAAARLKMSRKEGELLEVILGHAALLQTDLDVPAMVTLLRDLGDAVYPVVIYGISRDLVCQMAEHPVLSRARGLLAFFEDTFIPRRAALPVLTGDDLIRELGISPSPLLGRILEGIERAFLEGKVATPSEAMALAGELLRGLAKSETS